MNEETQPIIPKWLTELQQRSWEPEILLSGIVLYGMFKVPELLDDFQIFFKATVFANSQDIDNFVALSKIGIYWLISGLILHLICRGIWIGMVGLSYSFPNGIRTDKVNYKERFKDKLERTPGYEQIVIRLEKISSSLFSVSFMLFMSLIGGYIYFLVLVILPFTISYIYFDIGFEGVFFQVFQAYVFIVVIIGLFGLLDFVTLGYFRRFKWFAKIFWPFHKVISVLTLSRFYRPIYYGLVTNFNKWVLFLFLLIFTFISIAGAGNLTDTTYPGDPYSRLNLWSTTQGYSVFVGYYQDQNSEYFSVQAQIPSDIITGDVLKLFVVANISWEDEMLELTPLDSLKELYPDKPEAALKMDIIKSFYEIQIDSTLIEVPRWYAHYRSTTNQRGYLAYIDISGLSEGMHHVTVGGNHEKFTNPFAYIPFYRDITLAPVNIQPAEPSKEKSVDFQPKPFGIRE